MVGGVDTLESAHISCLADDGHENVIKERSAEWTVVTPLQDALSVVHTHKLVLEQCNGDGATLQRFLAIVSLRRGEECVQQRTEDMARPAVVATWNHGLLRDTVGGHQIQMQGDDRSESRG